jgi:hypothetical protein
MVLALQSVSLEQSPTNEIVLEDFINEKIAQMLRRSIETT